MTLLPHVRREIAGRALIDERTIKRAYRQQTIKPTSYERVRRAALEVGAPPPPPPPAPKVAP